MSNILLKCEVFGCTFLTPKLPTEYYRKMVEHLKVKAFSVFNQGLYPAKSFLFRFRDCVQAEVSSAFDFMFVFRA